MKIKGIKIGFATNSSSYHNTIIIGPNEHNALAQKQLEGNYVVALFSEDSDHFEITTIESIKKHGFTETETEGLFVDQDDEYFKVMTWKDFNSACPFYFLNNDNYGYYYYTDTHTYKDEETGSIIRMYCTYSDN